MTCVTHTVFWRSSIFMWDIPYGFFSDCSCGSPRLVGRSWYWLYFCYSFSLPQVLSRMLQEEIWQTSLWLLIMLFSAYECLLLYIWFQLNTIWKHDISFRYIISFISGTQRFACTCVFLLRSSFLRMLCFCLSPSLSHYHHFLMYVHNCTHLMYISENNNDLIGSWNGLIWVMWKMINTTSHMCVYLWRKKITLTRVLDTWLSLVCLYHFQDVIQSCSYSLLSYSHSIQTFKNLYVPPSYSVLQVSHFSRRKTCSVLTGIMYSQFSGLTLSLFVTVPLNSWFRASIFLIFKAHKYSQKTNTSILIWMWPRSVNLQHTIKAIKKLKP